VEKSHRLARRALSACLAIALLISPTAQGRAPARLVAIADVHGAYPQLVALLQSVRLIDTRLRWIGGSALLVQTGDVIDRGAQSRECLDLLMALETQAPKNGGAVIPLLGNHEVMNLMGQLGYVTPEIYRSFATQDSEKRRQQAYRDYLKFLAAHGGHTHSVVPPGDDAERAKWMDEHPPGFVEHRDAFGPKGKYGRWIRTHHAVVQIGDGVFLHGGLSPAFEIPSIRQLDERVIAELAGFDAIWQTLVDGKVIWRYMTLPEAVKFAGEEAAYLRGAGPAAASPADVAMQRLLDLTSWMIAVFPDGPLWYRGLAEAPEETLIDGVKALLVRLRVQYIVVGHTPQSNAEIVPRFGSRVFLIDTGMLTQVYQGRATALEIQNGRFAALSADRPAVGLPAPPPATSAPTVVRQSGKLSLPLRMKRTWWSFLPTSLPTVPRRL
jgi:hypothetical protein